MGIFRIYGIYLELGNSESFDQLDHILGKDGTFQRGFKENTPARLALPEVSLEQVME